MKISLSGRKKSKTINKKSTNPKEKRNILIAKKYILFRMPMDNTQ